VLGLNGLAPCPELPHTEVMPIFPHELHEGAGVYSGEGHKLGQLHRIVLKRSDLTLTHIVVDIGFLRSGHNLWEGGFGLDYDRVIPVDAIASAADDRIDLNLTAAQFKDAPEYTAESFESAQDLSPGQFDLADVVKKEQSAGGLLGGTGNVWLVERLNKSLNDVDLKEGMVVWRNQPHEKLGEVSRGLFDATTGRLQALVIARGFLLKRDVVLPARYIDEVIDDFSIHVEISDADLEQLSDYEASDS
jgi:uncharacterized protein YrrD